MQGECADDSDSNGESCGNLLGESSKGPNSDFRLPPCAREVYYMRNDIRCSYAYMLHFGWLYAYMLHFGCSGNLMQQKVSFHRTSYYVFIFIFFAVDNCFSLS